MTYLGALCLAVRTADEKYGCEGRGVFTGSIARCYSELVPRSSPRNGWGSRMRMLERTRLVFRVEQQDGLWTRWALTAAGDALADEATH